MDHSGRAGLTPEHVAVDNGVLDRRAEPQLGVWQGGERERRDDVISNLPILWRQGTPEGTLASLWLSWNEET